MHDAAELLHVSKTTAYFEEDETLGSLLLEVKLNRKREREREREGECAASCGTTHLAYLIET